MLDTTRNSKVDRISPGQISGTYGPGTWAAWLLAVISSLYIARWRSHSYTILSIIPATLYIEWAAIDVLKQVHAPNPCLEQFASATGISFWGLWYFSTLQHFLCIQSYRHHGTTLWRSRIRRSRILLALSSSIPVIAIVAATRNINRRGVMRYRVSPATTQLYPDLPFDPLDSLPSSALAYWYHYIILSLSVGLFCIQHFLAVLELTRFWGTYETLEWHVLRIFRITWINPLFVPSFMFIMLCFTSSLMFLVIQGAALEWWLVDDIGGDSTLCFFRPCGPQSLTESDQGFSLCCALVLFWWETGPDLLSRAILVARTIENTLQSIRENAQADIPAEHQDAWTILPAIWTLMKTFGEGIWNSIRQAEVRPLRVAQWPGSAVRDQPDLEQRWKELSEELSKRGSTSSRQKVTSDEQDPWTATDSSGRRRPL